MKDIFVKEDIAKPENRINLALFHIQMDEGFHKWFCEELRLPVSAIIYPTENLSGDRPDFIVKDADRIIGYIEVELGDENKSQLSTYRYKYENEQTKIFSITGKSFQKSDLSLEEISVFLSSKIDTLSNKQKVLSAQYLIKLIETYSSNIHSYTRNPVSDEVLNRPFVNKLLDSLEIYRPDKNQNRAEPGKYYIDTNSPKGFSFRVYSPIAIQKSTSLLSITKGRDYITFLSEEWYRKYLNHKTEIDVTNWINFISQDLKLPINTVMLKERLEISLPTVDKHFDKLLTVVIRLI
jgi:hypothetical protein